MKFLLIFLLTAVSLHAATIEIPGTGYEIDCDSGWKLLPNSEMPRASWVFSDHLHYLSGSVLLIAREDADISGEELMVQTFRDFYEKSEEVRPIAGMKTFRFSNPKTERECLVCGIFQEKFTLLVTVDGPSEVMTSRASEVSAFLSGLKKKK